ncbi:MAG TPA: LodA/GoxA family CTQ-dependent oxidase [Nostocaceae cyanobacterium]|nr:LodA/GoxA family CTQ-dependent oxidase [Nostocaceae cyanobacterium]
MADTYKVFPSIGVARVGNSEEIGNHYYLAPETSGGLPIKPGTENTPITENDLRDSQGKLKREGARFRVFCYPDGGGEPYEVLPESGIKIKWTVHLANKKAAWYKFKPVEGEGIYPPNTELRNPGVTDRASLIIDPGPRTLDSPGQSASFSRNSDSRGYKMSFPEKLSPFEIDTLGEIRTDDKGRLIVIGGLGHSGTLDSYPPTSPDNDLDYANNDNWWDDTSDGPVSATVILNNGVEIEAASAWVIVTPPAYAPEILAQITMYDVMFDVAVRKLGYRPDIYNNGYQTSYITQRETEIERILNRALLYKWVVADHGSCHIFDYENPANVRKWMRSPAQVNEHGSGPGLMPMLAGDESANPQGTSQYVSFTETQIFFADQWNSGKFTTGNIPQEKAPDILTRAALDNCSGAAFAPGIEMTWFSRRSEIYTEAFRLKKRDYGNSLSTSATPLAEGLEPGDFLKFMALPWQADFNECAVQEISGEKVNWWPAQRMLRVHRDGTKNNPWVGTDQIGADDYLRFKFNAQMVNDWSKLGFVLNVGTEQEPKFEEVQRTLT